MNHWEALQSLQGDHKVWKRRRLTGTLGHGMTSEAPYLSGEWGAPSGHGRMGLPPHQSGEWSGTAGLVIPQAELDVWTRAVSYLRARLEPFFLMEPAGVFSKSRRYETWGSAAQIQGQGSGKYVHTLYVYCSFSVYWTPRWLWGTRNRTCHIMSLGTSCMVM